MMKRFLPTVLVCAALVTGGPAWAVSQPAVQAVAPETTRPAPADVSASLAASAAADPAFARRVELARKLVVLEGTEAAATELLNELMPMLFDGVMAQPDFADMPEQDRQMLKQFLGEEFGEKFARGLIDIQVDQYARSFSEEELVSLIAIFDQPVMKKYVGISVAQDAEFDRQTEVLGMQLAMNAIEKYFLWKMKQ